MMGSYNSNEKLKFELINIRFKIYRACDEQARCILDEERSPGKLNLKDSNNIEPLRTELVEQIIKILTTEYIPEKTSRKVAMISEISSCIREEGKNPAIFANKFKNLVAKHAVQIGHIDYDKSCRMELMMVHIERLPP